MNFEQIEHQSRMAYIRFKQLQELGGNRYYGLKHRLGLPGTLQKLTFLAGYCGWVKENDLETLEHETDKERIDS